MQVPERAVLIRSAAALAGVAIVGLLFIASYADALHKPTPSDVPLAVTAQVPQQVTETLDSSPEIEAIGVATPDEAREKIDERDAYGSLAAASGGTLVLTVAPAAGPAVAQFLAEGLAPKLRQQGAKVRVAEVHPLPPDDTRGLVGFYTVVGWIVTGYLAATFLAVTFGPHPDHAMAWWRLAGLALLAIVVGFAGAALSKSIGGFGGSVFTMGVVGTLACFAAGAFTLGMQSAFGVVGTAIPVLLFVVLGNPASGGPFSLELLPGFWSALGPLLPTGAATSAMRDIAYFPEASVGSQFLVLVVWALIGAVLALTLGLRRTRAAG